jgi:hypothetical protein
VIGKDNQTCQRVRELVGNIPMTRVSQVKSSQGGREGDEEEDGSRGNEEMMRSIED